MNAKKKEAQLAPSKSSVLYLSQKSMRYFLSIYLSLYLDISVRIECVAFGKEHVSIEHTRFVISCGSIFIFYSDRISIFYHFNFICLRECVCVYECIYTENWVNHFTLRCH